MNEFFSRLLRKASAVVPPSRRVKNYSADSGYNYEYAFNSFIEHRKHYEYRFAVNGDRKQWMEVAVSLPKAVLDRWSSAAGRDFSASERFGVAKIALRRAFDSRQGPKDMASGVALTDDELREIAEFLGL